MLARLSPKDEEQNDHRAAQQQQQEATQLLVREQQLRTTQELQLTRQAAELSALERQHETEVKRLSQALVASQQEFASATKHFPLREECELLKKEVAALKADGAGRGEGGASTVETLAVVDVRTARVQPTYAHLQRELCAAQTQLGDADKQVAAARTVRWLAQ